MSGIASQLTLVVSAEGVRTDQRQVIGQANERITIALEPERRGASPGRPGRPTKGTYRGNLGLSKSPYDR